MLEIPTHQQIRFGDCCQSNMQAIVVKIWFQNLSRLIFLSQFQTISVNCQYFCVQRSQLCIDQLNVLWRFVNLSGDNFGKERLKCAVPKVIHQAIRPFGKLNVKTAANDRCVNVDSLSFHYSYYTAIPSNTLSSLFTHENRSTSLLACAPNLSLRGSSSSNDSISCLQLLITNSELPA
ncbi:MAG: hypothetical protein MHPDNHAH_01380 [Anaerolineales bacterium]|nr:hypothetical protein [Anaerolineales bacterium]